MSIRVVSEGPEGTVVYEPGSIVRVGDDVDLAPREPTVPVYFRLSESHVAMIDAHAAELDRTRSDVIRHLAEQALSGARAAAPNDLGLEPREPTVPVYVRLLNRDVAWIDRVAERLNRKRSEVVRHLVEQGFAASDFATPKAAKRAGS